MQTYETLGRTCLIVIVARHCAGCGSSENGASRNSISSRSDATNFSDRLSKASPDWRRALLLRAITDSDQTCDRVTLDFHQQDYRGMGMWRVHCHDRGDWVVFIGCDGNARAALCSKLIAGAPACAPTPNDTRIRRQGKQMQPTFRRLDQELRPTAAHSRWFASPLCRPLGEPVIYQAGGV